MITTNMRDAVTVLEGRGICMSQNDDLISRQDAIDALGEEPDVCAGNDEFGRGLKQGLINQWHYDVNALKAVPTAEERKAGTWKEFHGNKNMCICQSCGFMVNKSLLYDYTEKDPLVFKYCPSCGSYNGGAKRR